VELAYTVDAAFTPWVVKQGYCKSLLFSSMWACNTMSTRDGISSAQTQYRT
jgi:hypothetical protein